MLTSVESHLPRGYQGEAPARAGSVGGRDPNAEREYAFQGFSLVILASVENQENLSPNHHDSNVTRMDEEDIQGKVRGLLQDSFDTNVGFPLPSRRRVLVCSGLDSVEMVCSTALPETKIISIGLGPRSYRHSGRHIAIANG